MTYLFNPESLRQLVSPVNSEQLRADFDYPAGASDLELVQLEEEGPTGRFFQLTMIWQERRIERRFNRVWQEWEQTEVWKPFYRKLEPRYERYL